MKLYCKDLHESLDEYTYLNTAYHHHPAAAMRSLMILATTFVAVILQSGVYSRESDPGDSLIDSSWFQPTIQPSQWQAPLPTSNLIYQRELTLNCSGTAYGTFQLWGINSTGAIEDNVSAVAPGHRKRTLTRSGRIPAPLSQQHSAEDCRR